MRNEIIIVEVKFFSSILFFLVLLGFFLFYQTLIGNAFFEDVNPSYIITFFLAFSFFLYINTSVFYLRFSEVEIILWSGFVRKKIPLGKVRDINYIDSGRKYIKSLPVNENRVVFKISGDEGISITLENEEILVFSRKLRNFYLRKNSLTERSENKKAGD